MTATLPFFHRLFSLLGLDSRTLKSEPNRLKAVLLSSPIQRETDWIILENLWKPLCLCEQSHRAASRSRSSAWAHTEGSTPGPGAESGPRWGRCSALCFLTEDRSSIAPQCTAAPKRSSATC